MKSKTYYVGLVVLVTVSLLLAINKAQCNSINLSLSAFKPKLTQLQKSHFDHRDYHTLTLKNGLEVMLVNDQQQTNTIVSLAVGEKQYQPKRYYGVSHLVEHLIISKMKQDVAITPYNYKNLRLVNNLISFLVSKEQTTVALASLGKYLNDTEYSMTAIRRELTNVQEEQLSKSQNPTYIFEHINTKSLQGTLSKYDTEFDKILPKGLTADVHVSEKTIEDLKSLLIKVKNNNYVAKNIKLVVITPIEAELLIPAITKGFAALKATNNEDNREPATVFNADNLAKHLYLKTFITEEKLILQFPIKLLVKDHNKQPYQFLQYMLENRLPGSLYAALHKQGLITNLAPTFEPNKYNNQGVALVEFTLTQQGLFHKKAIVSAFFRYLHLIKSDGLNIKFALGFAKSLKQRSKKYSQLPSIEIAQEMSHRMLTMSGQAAITNKFYFAALDTDFMQKTIAQFSLNNLRLWHISNDQSTDMRVKNLLASYRIKKFSNKDKIEFLNNKISVSLPEIED